MPVTSNRAKKLQRTTGQRGALVRSLAIALIENESIETTEPKAKMLRPFVEKLITKAKKGDLHSRRQIIASLHSAEVTNTLVDEIAPKLDGRDSGYLRIERTILRRGDNAQMAEICFVDDLSEKPKSPKPKASESNDKGVSKTGVEGSKNNSTDKPKKSEKEDKK